MNEANVIRRVMTSIRNSVGFKMILIGILTLILLIPAEMVSSLIRERQQRRNSVIAEITEKWGRAQVIAGPILSIPYLHSTSKDRDGNVRKTIKHIHLLPESLNIVGEIVPSIRYRSIYEAVLYNSDLRAEGHFSFDVLSELDIPDTDIHWESAFVSIGVSDMIGIKDEIVASLNGETRSMNPGLLSNEVLESGVSGRIKLSPSVRQLDFSFRLKLNGSEEISFVPIGMNTKVNLKSEWESPSFSGTFLPESRTIGSEGFKAEWRVLHLNRNYPQVWADQQHNIYDSAFGVRLFLAVDIYQQSMRTAKYAFLFLLLTFTTFFFMEVLNRNRVHPIQYLLIGLALLIFYTLLLSISEHLSFGWAYLISSVATIAAITFYSVNILGNKKVIATLTGILTILYSYLYLLLQVEDYALLLGSVGLFLVLMAVMFLTRRIDWYSLKFENDS